MIVIPQWTAEAMSTLRACLSLPAQTRSTPPDAQYPNEAARRYARRHALDTLTHTHTLTKHLDPSIPTVVYWSNKPNQATCLTYCPVSQIFGALLRTQSYTSHSVLNRHGNCMNGEGSAIMQAGPPTHQRPNQATIKVHGHVTHCTTVCTDDE